MSDIAEPLAHIPAHGWTPELKARFLDRLAVHGNARAACRSVNLSAEAAYRLRRRDALFARGWAAALVLARENGQQVLGERAIEGVEEEIYYRGELVGTRRRFDGRLLLAHLARLDKLADEETAGGDAGRFDDLLDRLMNDAEDLLPPDEELVEAAGRHGANRHRHDELRLFREHKGYAGEDEDEEVCRQDFLEVLEKECEHADLRARAKAKGDLRDQRTKMLEEIDALCGWPTSEAAKDLPRDGCETGIDQEALAVMIATACKTAEDEPSGTREFSFPRTVSTVSTSALARALSGPPKGFAMTPRSPLETHRHRRARR